MGIDRIGLWTVAVTCLLLSAETALCAETLDAQNRRISSATHFGYALERDSSTGFRNAGGSVILLDAAYRISSSVDLGLRTTGSGAESDGVRFYRMAAGPLVLVHLTPTFALSGAVGRFRESGLYEDGDRSYRSAGYQVMLGWTRSHALTKTVSVAWGGFLTRHWGDFDQRPESLAAARKPRLAAVHSNIGGSQGIEIALRTAL